LQPSNRGEKSSDEGEKRDSDENNNGWLGGRPGWLSRAAK